MAPRNYSAGFVTKDRRFWRAVVSWQDEGGGQRRKTKTTGVRCYPDRTDPETGVAIPDNRGKATAETVLREWRDSLVAEDAEAERRGAVSCDTPLEEYARRYVEDKARSGSVRPVTAMGYRSYLKLLAGTALGACPVGEVAPRLIIEWERGLAGDGLAPTTLSHAHVFAKQVCTHARRVGDLSANPFDLVDAPRRARRPVNSLDLAGARRLGEALDGFGPSPLATAARLALMTGMRQGEICALRWRDVDLGEGAIRVAHALTRAGGRYELASPKTRESARVVPLGPALRSSLEARRALVGAERGELCLAWDDSLFVVGSAAEPRWLSPQVLGNEWRALVRALGLVGSQGVPPRFHDLRHTFATLAIAGGLDVKTVSAILGHSNAAMTLDVYADALADSKRAGMDEMDALLSGGE